MPSAKNQPPQPRQYRRCRKLALGAALVVATMDGLGRLAARPLDQVQRSGRVLLAEVLAKGRATVDLTVDDFVVRQGGRDAEVLDLHIADYPVAVLLDNGPFAGSDLDTIRRAARRFIERIGQRPVVVGTLVEPPGLVTSFDDDREATLAALAKVAAGGGGASRPLRAAADAARAIDELGAPFSAIVVIAAGPVDVALPDDQALMTPLVDRRAFVHAVAVERRTGAAAALPQLGLDVLRALADQTRGQHTTIYSAISFSAALDRLADRLATELMITFVPPAGASAGADVTVGIKIPGARVRGLGVSR